MFCIKCGVRLADTEKKCPLCGTVVYHPELTQADARPLYPKNQHPKIQPNPATFNGIMIIIYLIPILICLMSDLKRNGAIDWFGYALGGILVSYIVTALPLWFEHPNPVVFVPCDFAAVALYLHYICYASGGTWFLTFALPITGGLALIVCTIVTLTHYLKRGKLYIYGGSMIAFGGWFLMVELLLDLTFNVAFIGWANYPLIVLVLMGGALIYLGINHSARAVMERKLFF